MICDSISIVKFRRQGLDERTYEYNGNKFDFFLQNIYSANKLQTKTSYGV